VKFIILAVLSGCGEDSKSLVLALGADLDPSLSIILM
jgi:hypothetical protein